jgi:hypothetical protein
MLYVSTIITITFNTEAYITSLLIVIGHSHCFFTKRKFGGRTPLDLASQKPEILAVVKRFTSFSPSVNGHQDISTLVHQLQHSSSVTSGGNYDRGERVRSVSVSSTSRDDSCPYTNVLTHFQ